MNHSAPNLTQQAVNVAASALAKDMDETISKAISARIGEGWTLDQLRGRLMLHTQPSSGMDTYYLDGKALVRFFPLATRREGTMLRVTREYRLL